MQRQTVCLEQTSTEVLRFASLNPRTQVKKGTEMTNDSVETASGAVRGVREGDIWAFKGIPYGADTSGNGGRFRPPRQPHPWPGVRDCISYGPSCPQMTIEQMTGHPMPVEAETMMGVLASEPSTGEDCLVLNVWSPTLDTSAKLPILVWLHGGGLTTGSASWPLYDFANFARRRRVVVIGLNHRLGILGFLDLSHLGEEFVDSGIAGMLDIVAALRWVNTNVAGFGGDPDNVTVFGESGGGMKTSTLLAMPQAQGLMHKAFIMSGAVLTARSREEAASTTEFVVDRLGSHPADDLQAVEVSRLIDAEVALQGRSGNRLFARGFAPVLGPNLPDHPAVSIGSGLSAGVPMVAGCTTDEMLAFLYADPELWTLTDEGSRVRLEPLLGDETDKILSAYRRTRPDYSPSALLIAVATDAAFRMPHVRLAEAKLRGGSAGVWMYLFAWGYPDPTGRVRAAHGSDMPYFFDNVDKAPMAAGPHADSLVASMSGALAAFAYTGDPNHDGMPEWLPYDTVERPSIRFDVPCVLDRDPFGEERRCWEDVAVAGLDPQRTRRS